MPERSAPAYNQEGQPQPAQYGPTLPYAYEQQSQMERRQAASQAIQHVSQGGSPLPDSGEDVMNLHQFGSSHLGGGENLSHASAVGYRVLRGQKFGDALKSHVGVVSKSAEGLYPQDDD